MPPTAHLPSSKPTLSAAERSKRVGYRIAQFGVLVSLFYTGYGVYLGNPVMAWGAGVLLVLTAAGVWLLQGGQNSWVVPVQSVVLFLAAYLSRSLNGRPLGATDIPLQVVLFVVGVLPVLLMVPTRPWHRALQWAMLVLVVVALSAQDALIAALGRPHYPPPGFWVSASRWTVAGVFVAFILRYYTSLVAENEAQIKALLEEQRVINAQLQQQAARIEALQQARVESEKLELFQRVISSVAHRLNTPLSAIQSSAFQLLQTGRAYLLELIGHLAHTQPAWRLSADYLGQLNQRNIDPSFLLPYRERSDLKAKLTRYLEQVLPPDADPAAVANTLWDLGFTRPELVPTAYLLAAASSDGLSALTPLRDLHNSLSHQVDALYTLRLLGANLRTLAGQNLLELPQPIHLATFVPQLLSEFLRANRSARIDYINHLHPAATCQLRPSDLRTVLNNLLFNALEAQRFQGLVQVVATSTPTHASLSITDSGGGIPPEVQARIFEPFFSTKGIGEGMGMGLYLSKLTAERMGADLTFHCTPGSTTFTLSLPLLSTTLAPAAHPSAAHETV